MTCIRAITFVSSLGDRSDDAENHLLSNIRSTKETKSSVWKSRSFMIVVCLTCCSVFVVAEPLQVLVPLT
jgi:hypothetical protein